MTTMDTRPAFREAATWAGSLIEGVRPEQLDAATPCGDWTVRDLLGHMVAILDRVRAIGEGAPPFSIPGMLDGVGDDGWSARYTNALTGCEEVWSDDALLERPVQTPFGTLPGAHALGGYIVEYLVHGWDLAQATGQDSEAPAELAGQAFGMAQATIPGDARGGQVPFAAPVESRPEAGPTERLANWLGRAA